MLKRIALWLLMAALLSAVVGGVALKEMNVTIEGQKVQFAQLFKDTVSKPLHQEESVSVTSLEMLEIRTVSENIVVVYEPRQDVLAVLDGNITQSETLKDPKLVLEVIGNRVSADVDRENNFVGINIAYDLTLTVHVPDAFKPETELKAVSGNVTAPAYAAVKAETVSGNIKLIGYDLAPVQAKTTSGNIDLKGNMSDMTLKSVSGDIECEVDVLSGNVESESVSGQFAMALKEWKEGFKFKGDSTSGSISVKLGDVNEETDGMDDLETTVGSGKYSVKVHTVSGDIRVNDDY